MKSSYCYVLIYFWINWYCLRNVPIKTSRIFLTLEFIMLQLFFTKYSEILYFLRDLRISLQKVGMWYFKHVLKAVCLGGPVPCSSLTSHIFSGSSESAWKMCSVKKAHRFKNFLPQNKVYSLILCSTNFLKYSLTLLMAFTLTIFQCLQL